MEGGGVFQGNLALKAWVLLPQGSAQLVFALRLEEKVFHAEVVRDGFSHVRNVPHELAVLGVV